MSKQEKLNGIVNITSFTVLCPNCFINVARQVTSTPVDGGEAQVVFVGRTIAICPMCDMPVMLPKSIILKGKVQE